MDQASIWGRSAVRNAIPRAVYAYRVSFAGVVRVTTDPIEVARIRLAYPNARVEIIRLAA
jgi:poly(A) polymerase Pap1